ncbi:MAG: hypothetical protein HN737_05460 [Desulfobacterales bacterium]|jgi:hypothetical protein|nr:hypothetical protein [Desulfobacteraceae bacterium]MBT7696837.1 hypothetical protein [Desulfobacterales bacterium]
MEIEKIISGGQTGADQAALDVAIKLDISHGGWIPKDRVTENGTLPDKYKLNEMPTDSYEARTEKNVMVSDGTLIISHGQLSGGSKLTLDLAEKHNRSYLHIDLNNTNSFNASREINLWIRNNNIRILNVAGSRASKDPNIYKATMDVLEAVIYMNMIKPDYLEPEINNKTIPLSVEEAVNHLISKMPLKDKSLMANMTENELPGVHPSLGSYIINNYDLSAENSPLFQSCESISGNPSLNHNDAPGIIIKELWEKLRETHKLRLVK